ncbi:hypothetical protein [Oceanobacillus sojae]|uniref:Major facilitator superfamily (MFS) profile domain-containing protein n=1 Tax=Oceanobacillus sojae TaxID=582851 RepID=A0A511ZQH3_9BACI|nr:hypothetical protein [Oceanobacillus sojae]GEN89681.1 hypothetical protein OSO01_44200 [Oceanobacillus sojae]
MESVTLLQLECDCGRTGSEKISSIVGPIIGGFIAEYWHCGWIFYMNLPIGIFAFFIVTLKESKSELKRSIDWLGTVTFIISIVSVLLALILKCLA